MRLRAILLSCLLISSMMAVPIGAVAQQGQGAGGPPSHAGPPDHAAVNSVDVSGGGGPPSQANAWGLSASKHADTMDAKIVLDSEGNLNSIRVTDDQNNEGREVSVSLDAVKQTVDEIPDQIIGYNSETGRWTSEVRISDGSFIVTVPHFSTNTITFSGSYSWTATPASDGDTNTYNIDSGDIENVSLELTGNTSTLDQSTSAADQQNGDSIPISVDGTDSTDVQITMEGKVDSGEWSGGFTSMPTPRERHAVAVVDGMIYAMGGSDGSGRLSVVERYDPGSDSWTTVSSMPNARQTSAATIGSDVYAIGGYDGSGRVSTVERFTTGIEDPSVTLDGTTISYNGMLGSGDTKIDTVSVAPGSYSGDVSAANSVGMDVSMTWTETTRSKDPSISINGNSVSYAGTLSDGETVDISDQVQSSYYSGETQTLEVSVAPGVSSPSGRVGISYQHRAVDQQSVDYASETWSERYDVDKEWSQDADNGQLRIPWASDRIIGIDELTVYINESGSWTETSPDSYSWSEDSDLVVNLGSITAGDHYRVVAHGRKVSVPSGSISITEPTIEGNVLDSEISIDDDAGAEPVEIEVGGTVDGKLLHYVGSSSWAATDQARFASDGSQKLELPSASTGGTATITTAPITVEMSTGDAVVNLDNVDEPRFSIDPGADAGDSLTIGYTDTTSGKEYVLGDVSNDATVGPQTANSPVYFDVSDGATTWVVDLYDGSTTSRSDDEIIAPPIDRNDGISPSEPIVLVGGVVLIVGVGILSRRLDLSSRVTAAALILAVVGVIEVVTSEPLIALIGTNLLTDSGPLVSTLVGSSALVALWSVDNRIERDLPTAVYGLVAAAVLAWVGSSIAPDLIGSSSPLFALIVGSSIIIGLVVLDWRTERDLPRPVIAVVGVLATVWVMETIAPGILSDPLAAGLEEVGPLVWIAGLGIIAFAVRGWIRSRNSPDTVIRAILPGGGNR